MRKKGDISHSFVRYAVISTALIIVFLFVKKDNLISWVRAGFTLRRQEQRIEQLKTRNEELDRHIKAMSTDRDTLEKFAREEFLFAAPGDDVYLVEE